MKISEYFSSVGWYARLESLSKTPRTYASSLPPSTRIAMTTLSSGTAGVLTSAGCLVVAWSSVGSPSDCILVQSGEKVVRAATVCSSQGASVMRLACDRQLHVILRLHGLLQISDLMDEVPLG